MMFSSLFCSERDIKWYWLVF